MFPVYYRVQVIGKDADSCSERKAAMKTPKKLLSDLIKELERRGLHIKEVYGGPGSDRIRIWTDGPDGGYLVILEFILI